MAEILDQVVRAFGQRARGLQPGPGRQPQRVVTHRDHGGQAVQELQPFPDHCLIPRRTLQPGGHISRDRDTAGPQHPPGRDLALRDGLRVELGLTGGPVGGMPVRRGHPAQRTPVPHIGAEALTGHDQALTYQGGQCGPDGRTAHAVACWNSLSVGSWLPGLLRPSYPSARSRSASCSASGRSDRGSRRCVIIRLPVLGPPCRASTTGQRTGRKITCTARHPKTATGTRTLHHGQHCRIEPYLDQGGAARGAAGPASAPRALPWGPRPAHAGPPPGDARQGSHPPHTGPVQLSRLPRPRLSSSRPPRPGRPRGPSCDRRKPLTRRPLTRDRRLRGRWGRTDDGEHLPGALTRE